MVAAGLDQLVNVLVLALLDLILGWREIGYALRLREGNKALLFTVDEGHHI